MKEMNLWRNLTTQKGPQAVTRRSALTHCAPPCLSFSFHTLHVRARARTQASRAHVFVENKKLGRGAVAERLSCNGGWTRLVVWGATISQSPLYRDFVTGNILGH